MATVEIINWRTFIVHEVFENVAKDYDLMNDVMSLAIHRVWKDYFMMKLSVTDLTKLVDVAGGTGIEDIISFVWKLL